METYRNKFLKQSYKGAGFTLIETILYSAILAIFILFTFLLVNQLLLSNAQTRDNLEVAEDAEFILGKINWAMSTAQILSHPATNTQEAILEVNDSSGQVRNFKIKTGDLVLTIATGDPLPLNSPKTQITSFLADNIYDFDTGKTLVKLRFKVEKRPDPNTAVIASTTIETTYEL